MCDHAPDPSRPIEYLNVSALMAEEGPPEARFDRDRLLCDTCGEPADTIHLPPWCVKTKRIEAACPNCDPGGYHIYVDDLLADPVAWFIHLAGKTGAGQDHAVVVLLRWLAPLTYRRPLTQGLRA